MKGILLSFFLFNLVNVYSQEVCFSSLSEQEIIPKLFKAKWSNKTKDFIWKPTVKDEKLFGNSYDGYLHSKTDTVFNYLTSKNKYTIILVSTFLFLFDDYESCHACSPSMSYIRLHFNFEKKIYVLDKFVKFVGRYGSYGSAPENISLIQFGKNSYCIKISAGFTGQGVTTGYTSIFYDGEEILNFTTDEDNKGTVDEDLYEFSTSFNLDKLTNKIILNKKGTDIMYNGKSHKIVKVDESKTYKFVKGQLLLIDSIDNIKKRREELFSTDDIKEQAELALQKERDEFNNINEVRTTYKETQNISPISEPSLQKKSQDEEPVYQEYSQVEEPAFIVFDENATFKGGDLGAFRKDVQSKLVYTQKTVENSTKLRVFIHFTVNSKGEVCNVKVLRSSGETLFDNEAIRVINASPKWNPAILSGHAIEQQFTLPVTFY